MNSRELLLSRPSQAEYKEALASLLAFSTAETSSVQTVEVLPHFLGNIAFDFLTITRATQDNVASITNMPPHIIIAAQLQWQDRFLALGADSANSQVVATNSRTPNRARPIAMDDAAIKMSYAAQDKPHLVVCDGPTPTTPSEPATIEQALRAIGITQELAYGITEVAPKTPNVG